MGTGSVIFRVVLLAHIAAAIVAFGGLLSASVTNGQAFRSPAAESRVLLRNSQALSKFANYGMYALLLLGIVLIATSDPGGDAEAAFSFSDPWVSAAFVVWIAVVGIFHGMVRPAVAAMADRADVLTSADDVHSLDTDQEATGLAKRLAIGEAATQLLLVVSLVLMIWKPGA